MPVQSIFEPLDASKNEVRLLDILPSNDKAAEIRCTLRIVSLDDTIGFDALSWCWGDAPPTGRVTIHDQVIECSPNLEAALRNFRDPSTTRTFWVDATCINQSDLEEKSAQIPLMTRIYEGAEVVRVWLGESEDGSDDAVEVMRQLVEGVAIGECRLRGELLNEDAIFSLCLFLERPWWQRIWVVQEVALAREVIMYCGSATFDVVRFAETVEETILNFTRELQFQHIEDDKRVPLTVRLLDALESTMPMLQLLKEAKKIKAGGMALRHTIDSMISLTRLQATNPRDKVYGCLGLLPGLAFRPDYNFHPDVVYVQATCVMFMYCSALYPLCFVRPRRTASVKHGKWPAENITFPSWCLDFSQKAGKSTAIFMRFSCSGDWGPKFAINVRFPFIEVPGVFFDEIETCVATNPDWEQKMNFLAIQRKNHSKWRSFFGLELDRSNHSAYVGGGSVEDAYWRVIALDRAAKRDSFDDWGRLQAAQIAPFVKWIRDKRSHDLPPGAPVKETDKKVMAHYWSVHCSTLEECNTFLFKTRKGYMGMSTGVPDIRVGDHLYFMERGRVPWALRPVHHEVEGTVFEVASDCYVHGIMDGEAFKPPPTPESKIWKRHELRKKIFGGQSLDTDFPMPPWTKILLT